MLNAKELAVLTNIIGAVESGGQVYGQRNYRAYAAPYTNTSEEHTVTLGWAQFYGYEAKTLVGLILDADRQAFRRIDSAGLIEEALERDWERTCWDPTPRERDTLIRLIDSPEGRRAQDKLFQDIMTWCARDCEATYTGEIPAVLMYCEIRHLGGKNAADRIFRRCRGDYSLDSIMEALRQDQNDTNSNNQVGDKQFWSRHECCVRWIREHVLEQKTEEKETRTMDKTDALRQAKKLLRMPQGDTMTGYTPDGKSYFVQAGAWTHEPRRGDIIYFYSSDKGRVGHTGIVESVDTARKVVHTIEGNTRSDQYAENGGCVARHDYSYAAQGGTRRVNGFGRPNFEAVGVTPDQLVETAASFLGYLEKASARDLDDKTANAGGNNFTKFQRDVGAGNGDQWCQYFVDAMALYTVQGVRGDTAPAAEPAGTLHEGVRWTGYLKRKTPVRTWAGITHKAVSFSPLPKGTPVGVCDTLKSRAGKTWCYIMYNGKHGFIRATRITRVKPAGK